MLYYICIFFNLLHHINHRLLSLEILPTEQPVFFGSDLLIFQRSIAQRANDGFCKKKNYVKIKAERTRYLKQNTKKFIAIKPTLEKYSSILLFFAR